MAFFEQLTARFYERVAGDKVLRPLYPDDLGPPRRRLCLFLAQFWGGPRLYEEQRGDPRLRARHMRWEIGPRERDRWVQHMMAALEALPAGPLERAQLRRHFEAVANHLINVGGRAGETGEPGDTSERNRASSAEAGAGERSASSAGPGLQLQPPVAGQRSRRQRA
jgi:hemoglobin